MAHPDDRHASHRRAAGLDGEDERWVARVAAEYAPLPRTALQRAAFKARLLEQLAPRTRWFSAAPAWAMAALAAVLLLSEALPHPHAGPGPAATAPAGPSAGGTWERRLLYGETGGSNVELDAGLPPSYAAVAEVFLEE